MASGYALPTAGGSRHGHSYSYSYSLVNASPERLAPNAFLNTNGLPLKKAISNGNLYTHAELSRENSPNAEINQYHNHYPGFEQNGYAVKENGRLSKHAYSRSDSPMKKSSRPRGESDLGRPADVIKTAYRPTLESIPAASTSWFSLPEALTSLLIPMPYLFASASYSSMSGWTAEDFPPFAVYERLSGGTLLSSTTADALGRERSSGFLETCILTSSTLLLVGILAKMQSAAGVLDRRKGSSAMGINVSSLATTSALKSMALRMCSIALPFYAAMQLGGTRVGLVMLMAIAADLTCATKTTQPSLQALKDVWSSKVATSSVMVLCFIMDEAGLTIYTPLKNIVLGYLALATSVLFLQPPLPNVSRPSSKASSPTSTPNLWSRHRSSGTSTPVASPLTISPLDATTTLAAGVLLATFTILFSMLISTPPILSTSTIILTTFTVASMAASLLFSRPLSLRSESKAGLAFGCLITASSSFLFSPSLWPGTVCNGGLSALSFLGVLYDTNGPSTVQRHDSHDHDDSAHTHHHHHKHSESKHSAFTSLVLSQCEPGSLVYSILSEKDSRRIAYFTILNFAFMLVQGAYGYLSGSLGLLSDTVHMFFDCLGLIVGLGAAVASKWPTSPEKPYGWGKLNTLAGFGNGIFLMLVSIEFVWEAVEGILEQRELRHVEELLVVSTLGLLVNLVGLFAFGHAHAHAGHDHGHGHSHSHAHSHSSNHSQSHAHEHSHGLPNGHAHSHSCDHSHSHSEPHASHAHDHHNENMHGIFLHVAADAGGSLAVIISTALTLWNPWYLWDPLATIIIAVLIFAAAIPLVSSSGQKLLLVIPDELEYALRSSLLELGELRGVVGYAAPRFWVDDIDGGGDGHAHGHSHGGGGGGRKQKVMGVIHVIAAPGSDLEEVLGRVEELFAERRMEIVVHVEREGERCWCGGGAPKSS